MLALIAAGHQRLGVSAAAAVHRCIDALPVDPVTAVRRCVDAAHNIRMSMRDYTQNKVDNTKTITVIFTERPASIIPSWISPVRILVRVNVGPENDPDAATTPLNERENSGRFG